MLGDMLLTGRGGVELADWAVARKPGLKVLLMSGFLGDEVLVKAMLSGRFATLTKPFTPDGLARRVREVLDGKANEGR